MKAKVGLMLVALFLLLGISVGHAADIPVTFAFQTQGEADLASFKVIEYNEDMTPTGTTFTGSLTGGQIDVSSDQTLVYPDNAETTQCYTVTVSDESNNESDECPPVCKRVDEVAPGSCINFGIIDR